MRGACGTQVEIRNMYEILVEKSEGKRPLARPRRRGNDNIRMNLGKDDRKVWAGFIWLRIGTNGGTL
jgi:hypothetical protein